MSDISLHFTWYEWILAAIVIGWPGLVAGAVLGALLWRRRRLVGASLGACAGTIGVALLRLLY